MEVGYIMTRNQITHYFIFTFALALFLFVSREASAQYPSEPGQWAVKMFSELNTERTHDFGSVALHAEVVHRFAFKNIYQEDVEISSAQSNCGCTKVSVSRKVIPSGETGEIIARVDTSGKEHTKRRRATVTVVFSRPAVAEVQLQIQTYIRSDVGFEPGTVDFGTVSQGRNMTKKVYLQYEGAPNWALTSIRKTSNTIKAEAREVRREGGHVLYEISVSLVDDAPAGYLNGLLRFTTNEANSAAASIFLPIHGLIMEPLTAKPSYVQLGVVYPGEKITKNLVIRGAKPFRILAVSSPDSRIRFLVADDESPVHVIPVTFTAGKEVGDVNQVISIKTDQKELPGLEVDVTGFVRKAPARPEKLSETFRENTIETLSQSGQSRADVAPITNTATLSDALAMPSNQHHTVAADLTSEDQRAKGSGSQSKKLPMLLLKPAASSAESVSTTPEPKQVSAKTVQISMPITKMSVPETPEPVQAAFKPVQIAMPVVDKLSQGSVAGRSAAQVPVLTMPVETKATQTATTKPKTDTSGWSTVVGHKSEGRILR